VKPEFKPKREKRKRKTGSGPGRAASAGTRDLPARAAAARGRGVTWTPMRQRTRVCDALFGWGRRPVTASLKFGSTRVTSICIALPRRQYPRLLHALAARKVFARPNPVIRPRALRRHARISIRIFQEMPGRGRQIGSSLRENQVTKDATISFSCAAIRACGAAAQILLTLHKGYASCCNTPF
jgi:hypothetical protein